MKGKLAGRGEALRYATGRRGSLAGHLIYGLVIGAVIGEVTP